jgi:SnoaL-like protein
VSDRYAEVCQLQAAYCRGIDDRLPELLRSVVAGDVELVAADGSHVIGADAFVALFERYWAAAGPVLHLVSNVELLEDGEVRALFHAVSRAPDGQLTTTWGRYRDHVVRAADGRLVFAAKRIEPWGRARIPDHDR